MKRLAPSLLPLALAALLLLSVYYLTPPLDGAGDAWNKYTERQDMAIEAIWTLESNKAHLLHGSEGEEGRLGPFQIGEDYFTDAKVPGLQYWQLKEAPQSEQVVRAYMKRWIPEAWDRGDAEVILRTHNGGPRGASKGSTLQYWERGQRVLTGLWRDRHEH
jgi:hypothetical protein